MRLQHLVLVLFAVIASSLASVAAAPLVPIVSVDSSYEGYSAAVIDDGSIDAHGEESATWASDETTVPHWVELQYPSEVTVHAVEVHWGFNHVRNTYMTAQRAEVQVGSDRTVVASLMRSADVASSVVRFAPVRTDRVRILMPAGMGQPLYPEVMWLTEVDIVVECVEGDVNGDCAVDINDVLFVARRLNAPDVDSRADRNGDGTVNVFDIVRVARRWGTTYAPPAGDTVPPVRSGGSPSNQLATGTTSATLQVTTNEAATCRYSTSTGTAYASMAVITTTGGTSHSQSVTGLQNGQSYDYYVRCQDAAGNSNTDDYAISFSVAAAGGDVTPPVRSNGQPSGSLPAGTKSTTVSLSTNEAATCRLSDTANIPYGSMIYTFSGGGSTSHSFAVPAGLQDGQSYNLHVRCQDTVGNINTNDYTVSFSVAAPGAPQEFNEPAGFTPIVIREFNSKATVDSDRGTGNYPSRTGGSEGWDGIEYRYNNLAIAPAVDDPLSDGSAMRFTYPVGHTNNNGPGIAQTLSLGSPRNLYVRTSIRLGPTYWAGGVSNKLYFHRMTGTPRGEPILVLHSNDDGTFELAANFQGTPDNGLGWFYASGDASAMQRNRWYTLESLMLMNSAAGVRDGVFRVWVDGQLVIERLDVDYLYPGATPAWGALHISPTFGGSGEPNHQEFYWDLGHAYISGSS